MLYVVTGGSGSGKSEYAENLILSLGAQTRIYIATMIPWDEECERKISRHRKLRAQKSFETIERYRDLAALSLGEKNPAVLLECISNLAANELYERLGDAVVNVADTVIGGISCLYRQCADLVVVTNEVFSDGADYDPQTREYQRILGEINQKLAFMADQVTEVVYGIPVLLKTAGSIQPGEIRWT